MKTIYIICILFAYTFNTYAQKELWGVNDGDYVNVPGFPFNYGKIVKYDINGENPEVMHDFDSIQGYRPLGRLFLASNGKLYGTAVAGGETGPVVTNANAGVLFEYDLILNKYSVLHYFGSDNIGYSNPDIGVIEPTPGILCGATQNRIYNYDIATESMTFSNPLLYQNIFTSELMKASNGYIYGVSYGGYCQNVTSPLPYLGNIIKYDIVTNNVSFAHSITCPQREIKGAGPRNQLVEASVGKLYGTCVSGGINEFNDPDNLKGGTLFEFNIDTDAYTKKIDFDFPTIGARPFNLVIGDNSKIYGICEEGGASQSCDPTNNFGALYEYTPTTNVLEVKQYLNLCTTPIRYPQFLMRTSNGYFMGITVDGNIFKYDAVTNEITYVSTFYKPLNLIEICRKPSYHFFDVDTFDACAGGTFNYDVQNTNAINYQWKKNEQDVIGQTTGVLNLTNLQASDAGDYTCLMTNECGTTTTMVLHLTVSCLGINTYADLDKSIKLFPNPTEDILNIKLPENIEVTVTSIKIANSLGQIIREQKIQNNGAIDVSQLQTGIYVISFTTNYGDWKEKFVKE
ncbi:choice-of-anchor tandem repeat GloVer-containing protein [Flavobacterium sp. Sd200]|uniref:choice-of-anchor tandem repeat GloVer-containing protein n=1 Tax=Flavobacterium sp. Sd200 TaxID=2692211 RepID=UPI001F2FD911|nr:choice-of-anchor tandem repeat GloVer-containing protein [Flavobacterium sp. Sd200]